MSLFQNDTKISSSPSADAKTSRQRNCETRLKRNHNSVALFYLCMLSFLYNFIPSSDLKISSSPSADAKTSRQRNCETRLKRNHNSVALFYLCMLSFLYNFIPSATGDSWQRPLENNLAGSLTYGEKVDE